MGSISTIPILSFWLYDYNNSDVDVDFYVDVKTWWIGAASYKCDPWESVFYKEDSFRMSSGSWSTIYDGKHELICVVKNKHGLIDEFIVDFVRIGNPRPPMLLPNPIDPPSLEDNGDVQMGVLRHIHKYKNGSEEVTDIAQGTSSGFTDKPIMIEHGLRDSDGWLIDPHCNYNEQVTFVDTDDTSKQWKWIKATVNGKTLLISTTMGPRDALHPTARINVTLNGTQYILRHLSFVEWRIVDDIILERMDFGTCINNVWDIFYAVTSTLHEFIDETIFANTTERSHYWNDLTSSLADTFITMSYINAAKAKHFNCRKGWSKFKPCRPHALHIHHRWLPVLELVNRPPVIDLPDKDKDDPTVRL